MHVTATPMVIELPVGEPARMQTVGLAVCLASLAAAAAAAARAAAAAAEREVR